MIPVPQRQMPPYVAHRLGYQRRASRAVRAGSLVIGGGSPVVIQSMCTTPTQDVAATVAQCISLAEVGCQLIHITAPGVKDAQALAAIRAGFSAAGFATIPLVADIHFMPAAAMEAIEHVEKVRINPGNFADKKRFAVREYSDADYAEELARVADRFLPLVRRARTLGRCLRIGTNHGSLSDRIMNRFGDTPQGMVESAMEFIQIAESEGFRDLVISMKSSNPKVMVAAYRLLCSRLEEHGVPYPLHLGVTEAGDGEDGRAKGAAGIGCLLEDGIGDTIRVSLTEPPEAEIPVARALAARYAAWPVRPPIAAVPEAIDPYAYRRRVADIIRLGSGFPIGGGLVPRVLVPIGAAPAPIVAGQPVADGEVAEAAAGQRPGSAIPRYRVACGDPCPDACQAGSILSIDLGGGADAEGLGRTIASCPEGVALAIGGAGPAGETRAYRLLAAVDEARFRAAEAQAVGSGRRHPIVLGLDALDDELAIACVAGGLLVDGIGDALYLPRAADPRRLAYTILQAVKARVTRADYVACPSCGRTLFDLMEVTAHIKEVTQHLDGVTIAIMGCIVNGPGEMADADFGFVGSGPGRIDLYRGKEKVRAAIPFQGAREQLVELIREAGLWRDPPAPAPAPASAG